MPRISLNTATALTGISKRTLWRRIADGLLRTMDPEKRGERAQLDLDEVLRMACIPLASDDIALVVAADAGEAEAQCDLALLFLKAGRPTGALYWLELAAAQSYPEAMYWLGRCHVSGGGVPRDENIGISWLARAASHGHVIAREQMQALQGRNGQAVAPLASGGGGGGWTACWKPSRSAWWPTRFARRPTRRPRPGEPAPSGSLGRPVVASVERNETRRNCVENVHFHY